MDLRLNELYDTYETEWDDTIIPFLQHSFPVQIEKYIKNYKLRLEEYKDQFLQDSTLFFTKNDPICKEYLTIGLFVLWISLQRTLDVRMSYMLLQRTSILFTQYIITYSETKKQNQDIEFSISSLISFITINLLGDITLPVKTNMDNKNRDILWKKIIYLYSKYTLEYE